MYRAVGMVAGILYINETYNFSRSIPSNFDSRQRLEADMGLGSAAFGPGSMVGVVRSRSGDLNMRENYVFVFCLFRQDDIYCWMPVLAHAFCMACRSGDLG